MITSKELRYVNLWASKVPMPGIEYSIKVLQEIEACYKLYNEKCMDKEYSIIFSNSEEVDFEIKNKNLCHLLGIDYKNIKGSYFDDYRRKAFGSLSDISSFELIELIIDNMDKVALLDNDRSNKAKAINYYKSSIKCAIFNKLCNFDKINFGAINFNGDREEFDYDKQKILFVPSNEAIVPYYMMVIKEDNFSADGKYIAASLMAPENPKDYFENQEAIIPTQILVSDNNNLSKVTATAEDKIKLLTMYSDIINKYGIPHMMNIYGDYLATLNDLSNSKVYTKIK